LNEKIKFEAGFPHPVEKIWEALTRTDALAEWLMAGHFSPEEGAEFRLEEPGLQVFGEVCRVVPNKKLSYTWVAHRDDDDDVAGTTSLITWTLTPVSGGTRLQMEQELLEPAKPIVLIESAVNWSYAIHSSLFGALNRRYRQPTPIVYVTESRPLQESSRRAGFRQPEEVTV
jgi:uncharacterized protein YndB with AHSA1/START domain